MSAVLLDTHAWIWSLVDSSRLSDKVKTAIVEADSVHVSPISAYEVTRKARLGEWREITPHIGRRTRTRDRIGLATRPFKPNPIHNFSTTRWQWGKPMTNWTS